MGVGGVIHFKVILVPQKILNKTSNLWPNISKILVASVFQNWQIITSKDYISIIRLHFHICCFSINKYEWMKNFYGVFMFWVSNQKNNLDIGQKPYRIPLLFFALSYSHWKSQSSIGNRKLEANSVNVVC